MDNNERRALVARMQERVSSIDASENGKRELTAAWDALVTNLALGPAPETRSCPKCKSTIMRAATLCGHCWTKLGEGHAHG